MDHENRSQEAGRWWRRREKSKRRPIVAFATVNHENTYAKCAATCPTIQTCIMNMRIV